MSDWPPLDPVFATRATFEARFLAGRARLAFGPPGSWPRSPQLPLKLAAIMRHHTEGN